MIHTKESIRAAADKIIAAVENDELQPFGGCRYEDKNGKPCAIGYLMTKEQRAQLRVAEAGDGSSLNNQEISDENIATIFGGVKALEAQIGMPLELAAEIQKSFDFGGIIKGCKGRKEDFIQSVEGIVNDYEA